MSDAPADVPPQEAIDRLLAGNQRFRDYKSSWAGKQWNRDLSTAPQWPFAVILGCSDSRTPIEILFDQGFGDLFVVRVAGNIVAPSIIGSVEFAVSKFNSRLVVVMGHTRCGAISASIDAIESGENPASRNLRAITARISPHIEELVRMGTRDTVWDAAMRANVRASVDHLTHGSALLESMVERQQIAIVGAEYQLETGLVRFLKSRAVPSGG